MINNEETIITIYKDYIDFMGEKLYPPFELEDVKKVLGNGNCVVINEELNIKYQVWNDLGIFGWLNKECTYISCWGICLSHHQNNPSSHLYKGQIWINQKNYRDCQWKFDSCCQELKQGCFSLTTLLPEAMKQVKNKNMAALLSSRIEIDYTIPKVKCSQKYTLHQLKEPILKFSHFPLKLAVIQQLMYEKHLLIPQFDIYEFVKEYSKRKIDIDEEGYDVIQEAKKWFENIQIPQRLANEVTELNMDGGNQVYLQIIPFWDGEDDIFDINEVDESELQQFPHLKYVRLMSSKPEQVIPIFKKYHIEVDLL